MAGISTYIKSMVERFNLTNAKRISMLMVTGVQFSIRQGPSMSNQVARMHGVPHAEAMGSILWPVVILRPDAAHAVGVLLGDAPHRLTSPPIFLRHLCIFLLIVASPRRSALAAPIPESDDHVM